MCIAGEVIVCNTSGHWFTCTRCGQELEVELMVDSGVDDLHDAAGMYIGEVKYEICFNCANDIPAGVSKWVKKSDDPVDDELPF